MSGNPHGRPRDACNLEGLLTYFLERGNAERVTRLEARLIAHYAQRLERIGGNHPDRQRFEHRLNELKWEHLA